MENEQVRYAWVIQTLKYNNKVIIGVFRRLIVTRKVHIRKEMIEFRN